MSIGLFSWKFEMISWSDRIRIIMLLFLELKFLYFKNSYCIHMYKKLNILCIFLCLYDLIMFFLRRSELNLLVCSGKFLECFVCYISCMNSSGMRDKTTFAIVINYLQQSLSWIIVELMKKILLFLKSEDSLSFSQELATDPYPVPD
jgi:hypothetical protein